MNEKFFIKDIFPKRQAMLACLLEISPTPVVVEMVSPRQRIMSSRLAWIIQQDYVKKRGMGPLRKDL